VATTDGFVEVQNANIYGKLRTGPNGSYAIGANGKVGPLDWAGPGIKPGWYENDFNMDFPDVIEPYSPASGLQPTSTNSGGNATWILGSGRYTMSSLSLQAGDTLLVTRSATLYVTGNVDMKSQGNKASQIVIKAGATLKLYVAGASANFTQVNTEGNASTFQYYGLPSNRSLTWSGNAQYMGQVYAPNADFSLGGGGNNAMDFQGALVVRSITMNGHFNVHYDENLKRAPVVGFRVVSWREL
jgi:hypothetical protein